tara:strand:+ start:691 stop:1560 length:870 start_codon:yes stop_codon:yes gene_type:complete
VKLGSTIELIRLNHYIKNFFVFLPLFFAIKITDLELLSNAFIAFIAFSFSASAVYIFNDLQDIKEDKQHPSKKFRPIASGAITQSHAIIVMLVLFVLGFSLMIFLSLQAVSILTAYIALNIAYSYSLKHIAIVDINIIAIGFVLRLLVGSVVTGTLLSQWIIIMTYLLALFIALAKRRDDVLIFLDTGKKMRKVIGGYNIQFLDIAMSIMASVVIVSYILYTTSPEVEVRLDSENLYMTSFFVILGIMRYLKIVFIHKDSGSPTKILTTDKFMQLVMLGWLVTVTWILY